MLTLPKDVQRKLALDLSPPDLIHLCLSNKEIKKDVCDSKGF
jgi:hypothetical protein